MYNQQGTTIYSFPSSTLNPSYIFPTKNIKSQPWYTIQNAPWSSGTGWANQGGWGQQQSITWGNYPMIDSDSYYYVIDDWEKWKKGKEKKIIKQMIEKDQKEFIDKYGFMDFMFELGFDVSKINLNNVNLKEVHKYNIYIPEKIESIFERVNKHYNNSANKPSRTSTYISNMLYWAYTADELLEDFILWLKDEERKYVVNEKVGGSQSFYDKEREDIFMNYTIRIHF